ncbi:ABC transporter ATP-binding protein, partial [Jatrophihabitans endophyticus]|uniref:ABC transporter ATP-binding protein n=1 Tax=Jatrophihabitans endophyticus TaxID=1206085 RepID=UPI001A073DF8
MSFDHSAVWSLMGSSRRRDATAGKQIPRGTWTRVLRFAAPYRRQIVVFLVLVVCSAVIGVVTPILAGRVVNDITARSPVHTVVDVAVLIAALAVVNAALSFSQRYYSASIGEGLIYDMRTAVFDHVQRMPLAFFTRTQTGALISRLNNDVLGAQQAFTSTLSGLVSNVVGLVLTAAVMFTLSWPITLISLVMLPLFVLPARRIGTRLQEITRESYQLNASMNATMTERFNVAGALLVKLFGRPDDEDASFRGRALRVRDIGVTSAMYGRAFFVSLTLVAALAQALVYGLGGYFAVRGSLSAGTVVTLALLLTQLYGPLTSLSNARVDIMSALVSFDRVFEVLDLEPMIADAPDAVELPPDSRTVEFEDVRFGYPTAADVSLASLEDVAVLDTTPSTEVLHGVSFRAAAGEMIALVGPSGAGKTTISQLLPRIYDVTAGRVLVGGHDVRSVTQQSLHDCIGVVSQDAHMFHDTVRGNLEFAAPDADEDALWAALDAAQIGTLVRSLPDGLDTVVGDRGYRLSGGEKARLAIARLLLKAPQIVILDEATAHLDSESEALV